jgi:hypothetical protein
MLQSQQQNWIAATASAWRDALTRSPAPPPDSTASGGQWRGFTLQDETVVERKILASRLANAASECAGADINTLKLRIQHLEQTADWPRQDVLRPETLAFALVNAWLDCGLSQPMWNLALPAIQPVFAERMAEAYRAVNGYLIQNGVMAEIDLKSLVKRDQQSGQAPASARPSARLRAKPVSQRNPAADWSGAPAAGGAAQKPPGAPMPRIGGYTPHGLTDETTAYVRHSALARADDETRMETGAPPLARIRERAQGVLGQLRRLLGDRIGGIDTGSAAAAPASRLSPPLARALAEPLAPFAETELMGVSGSSAIRPVSAEHAQSVAAQLRKRATELKAKAEKPSEKAIIEIVALMFQAILAEERIAPSIRVWFARLQIPVLRLALAEPDFFASSEHPARQLIDRMGACALGFDAAHISGSRLEREIKRIVQVIEQYPETGRRVYQLVLEEFKKFLGRSLTEDGAVRQVATLAQQIEQKEALSIQYTIELRRMLDHVPVTNEVREFLFHVWSEALAMAAVRHGPQHAQTLRLKQAAADLLWAVSPRSDRAERGFVLQKLPDVIAVLREGMGSLAIAAGEQDGHIKLINDAVMQAFVSGAESIAQSTLDDLARGLAELEDVVTDDPEGDLLLDTDMIELMFGVEGDTLEVISSGGSQPSQGMLQWARELELGAWFSLELRGAVIQVQYAWRSARGQLHLLANSGSKTYLVQTRRLASYLQAGLLTPLEDEALTVRATRQALDRLKAAPDLLLH